MHVNLLLNIFNLPTGITRIKGNDDDVAEMNTTPGLITEPAGPRHPSITVEFTLKVRCC